MNSKKNQTDQRVQKLLWVIYIFKWKLIRQYLIDDGNDPESEHDFW